MGFLLKNFNMPWLYFALTIGFAAMLIWRLFWQGPEPDLGLFHFWAVLAGGACAIGCLFRLRRSWLGFLLAVAWTVGWWTGPREIGGVVLLGLAVLAVLLTISLGSWAKKTQAAEPRFD